MTKCDMGIFYMLICVMLAQQHADKTLQYVTQDDPQLKFFFDSVSSCPSQIFWTEQLQFCIEHLILTDIQSYLLLN